MSGVSTKDTVNTAADGYPLAGTVFPPAGESRATLIVNGAMAVPRGHLPGWAGIGNDVPADVIRQWSGWCRQPGYATEDDPVDASVYSRLWPLAPDWLAAQAGRTR